MLLNQLGLVRTIKQEIEKVQLSINNIDSNISSTKRTIEMSRLLGKRDGLERVFGVSIK
ncbi:hypothetical protein, partial [Clostridium botulinum]|uniref:hypothetical protein n=1 Tax=Clostridium botulinum TaxID=1491 RepID=UPI0015C31A24